MSILKWYYPFFLAKCGVSDERLETKIFLALPNPLSER